MRGDIPSNIRRVGFVATRLAGTDGVSLETFKWAEILAGMGLECRYIAGELEDSGDRSVLIEEAHFQHDAIRDVNHRAFILPQRDEWLSDDVYALARQIRERLKIAIHQLKIDVLIAENSLTIPMNLPLGLALVQTIQELDIPCIAHHHDFYWERPRFLVNNVGDFLRNAFPPVLNQIQHVAISGLAAEELSHRTGVSCRIIPNVMDFAHPPKLSDDRARQFREIVGVDEDDLLVLQPTRVVARKGIEHAIELLHWLGPRRAKLVITHASGDEGDNYTHRVRRFAELMNVDVVFAAQWVRATSDASLSSDLTFSIGDAYHAADLVTYPSTYEGFGNAFLEAIYFKRPLVCNRHAIFRTELEPCGFRTIAFDGYLNDDAVEQTQRVLRDEDYRSEMVEHNYRMGQRFFAYNRVERELRSILGRPDVVCRCETSCCTPP